MPEWAALEVQVGRGVLVRVDRAFQDFFRRIKAGDKPGHPRFRSALRYRSVELNDTACRRHLTVSGDKGKIAGKGLPIVRFRAHRELPEGQPSVIRIIRKARGVYVDLVYGLDDPPTSAAIPANPIGVDGGITDRLATSTGERIPYADRDRRRLRRLQRWLSRAKRGSNGRRRKVASLAREHQRLADADRGKCHELATALVQMADFIAVEVLGNYIRDDPALSQKPR